VLPVEVGVPGRIDANPDRRVEIRPRAAGVVREVHALLGQRVTKGDVLVVLDSPDIGSARLNLRARQRELVTARNEADWKNQVAANVSQLIPELRKGVAAATIEQQYADRPLGSNRALLLQAYAEYEIASHEAEKTSDLRKREIIGEHPFFVAHHAREGAQAKYEAALEQVRFDANQQKLLADQQVRQAEAAVIDAAQRLRILGVSENVAHLLAHASDAVGDTSGEDVTAYAIVAPFDGTIIGKSAVPSQKAEMNDVLFTLADLSTVWVIANINESDLRVLPDLQGSIRLTATAYPGRTFEAKLLSVGAQVDPTTRTVPLLAETPNPDGLLKVGMFVRIVLDGANTERTVTVPTASIVEIEGQKVVFLPSGKDERTFTVRPVKLGREVGGRQTILAGLASGEMVVSSGAFFLKSELILQNETEED
jgi:RND family efflux transporter MFP subunit